MNYRTTPEREAQPARSYGLNSNAAREFHRIINQSSVKRSPDTVQELRLRRFEASCYAFSTHPDPIFKHRIFSAVFSPLVRCK